MLIKRDMQLGKSAIKAGMDEKTARKYLKQGKLPSQVKKPHTWRTRTDAFKDVWDDIKPFLEENQGIEAKSLFSYLQREYPGKFQDGQLRTFQRKMKRWRALKGPYKEVYFAQEHYPGDLCASDFTSMNSLNITINRERFEHLIFHFVLTYSNWETGTICFSESFESLSQGLQNALWELGGVTKSHRSDNLTAAVYKDCNGKEFTPRYKALLKHYALEGKTIESGKPNQNGDAEQSHNRFKKAVKQALILRGSCDFSSREEYSLFLKKLFTQRNLNRKKRFEEELQKLKSLPKMRLNDYKRIKVKVGQGSTISIAHNVYSVNSRLIGEIVGAKLNSEHIEIYYGQKKIDEFPRLIGKKKHHIEYRHIIDWLVRKPGAFNNYRYKKDLFPTIRFRMAYDYLKENNPAKANKEYLKILYLAAKETETEIDEALKDLFKSERSISEESVKEILGKEKKTASPNKVKVEKPNLKLYDSLITGVRNG
jgi:transposase